MKKRGLLGIESSDMIKNDINRTLYDIFTIEDNRYNTCKI